MNSVQHIDGNPSDEEAAAAIAAIERFLADTTVLIAAGGDKLSGWRRAAIHEAVGLPDPSPIW